MLGGFSLCSCVFFSGCFHFGLDPVAFSFVRLKLFLMDGNETFLLSRIILELLKLWLELLYFCIKLAHFVLQCSVFSLVCLQVQRDLLMLARKILVATIDHGDLLLESFCVSFRCCKLIL